MLVYFQLLADKFMFLICEFIDTVASTSVTILHQYHNPASSAFALEGYYCRKERSRLGEERVYLAYASASQFIFKGSQGRNSNSRNLEAGADGNPWRGEAYCLATLGWLSLLPYRIPNLQPRNGTTHKMLGPPSSITN